MMSRSVLRNEAEMNPDTLRDALRFYFITDDGTDTFPALEQAHEAGTRGETKADLSQVGIALSRYQKQNGNFPDSLDPLAPDYLPALPADPYTGKPFVYRIDDEGALIYSLGKNLKDDGGKPLDDDYQNHDHVFRVTAR